MTESFVVEAFWFNGIASTDEHDAYLHLVTAIAAMAREQKRISVQDKADFTLRWCAASSVITPTEYRVVMDGQIYDILSVDHMNFKHKSVKLRCRKARR